MTVKTDLAELANEIMLARGLEPEFTKAALQQLSGINEPAAFTSQHLNLSSLLWCSIDNDDSLDLDQLTYAESRPNGKILLFVAVADVAALVEKDTPIDIHAQTNTTSVYTPSKIYPMLPERLSTNLTSLNEGQERLSMVVKIEVSPTGDIESASIFQAIVHNYAKLTYSAIGGWLEGKNPLPDKVKKITGLEKALKIQHEVAQLLKRKRHEAGSLTLESSDPEVKIASNDQIVVQLPAHNFAHQLIEEFMIAANRVMAEECKKAKIASLRRVVRIPKYWNRIVEVAKGFGETLPEAPDSKALDAFLIKRRKADLATFPDLSLTIIKLLGRGEYIVENDTNNPVGHFALAITDYAHSTAPNRRYPDLICQRQYKAFLLGKEAPYSLEKLYRLAAHCTEKEDTATKVERQLNKCAAAALLSSQIGTVFSGIITGVGENGTWVRILEPAVEGKVIQGTQGLNIGDKVFVQLKFVDIRQGFIDFAIIYSSST